jgi:hypothetical protein
LVRLCGAVKRVLEITRLAAIDIDNHTGFHLEAVQTIINEDGTRSLSEVVKSRVWAPGLKIKLDASVNSLGFERKYESNKELWDKVPRFFIESGCCAKTRLTAISRIKRADSFLMVSILIF